MARGECNCGAVAFETDAELKDVYVCHCSICRKVANEAFRWLRGEDQITAWTKPNTEWHGWFCRVCGSPVPGANDPTRTFIPAGLIVTGGDDLKVAHHIWVGSKAVWDEIGGAGKQHPEAFKA
jgi:hypothetical protein